VIQLWGTSMAPNPTGVASLVLGVAFAGLGALFTASGSGRPGLDVRPAQIVPRERWSLRNRAFALGLSVTAERAAIGSVGFVF
jgi:hypothetical protein